MFGTLGGPELILIMVVALIIFGPRQLPEMGRSLGKMIAEFRKASNDFQRTIEDEVAADQRRSTAPIAAPSPASVEPPPAAPETPAAPAVPADTVSREPIEPR